MMRLRPAFSYYGSKWMLAPHYPAPTHGVIVEPFAGSACYSLLHYDRDVLLIDKNPDVVDTWAYILSASPSEILDLPDLPPSGVVADMGLPRGPSLLVRWWVNQASSSPAHRASVWAQTYPNKHWSRRVRERIAMTIPHLRHWRVMLGDYTDAPDINATWFVDPPYAGRPGSRYPHGSRGIDYSALARWCQHRKGQTIVCEHDGANWLPVRPFRALRSAAGRVERIEAVWTSDEEAL